EEFQRGQDLVDPSCRHGTFDSLASATSRGHWCGCIRNYWARVCGLSGRHRISASQKISSAASKL
ncbi:hypothetical protein, partial [Arthrobacter sp. DR-2P]